MDQDRKNMGSQNDKKVDNNKKDQPAQQGTKPGQGSQSDKTTHQSK